MSINDYVDEIAPNILNQSQLGNARHSLNRAFQSSLGQIPRRLRRNKLQHPKGAVECSRTAKRVRRSKVISRLLAAEMFIKDTL